MDRNDKPSIVELREHTRVCLLDAINSYRQGQASSNEHCHQTKSWAISVFIATLGFTFIQGKSNNLSKLIILGLPIIPILLFWILYALSRFYQIRQHRKWKRKQFERKLSELAIYSYNDLEALCVSPITNSSKNFPKSSWRRFKKKINFIIYSESHDLRSLSLFGGMLFIWLIVAFLLYLSN